MSKRAEPKLGKDGRISLTIRLKPETYHTLEEKAKNGFSKNVWVQELLDQFLDRVQFQLIADQESAWNEIDRRKEERRKLGS